MLYQIQNNQYTEQCNIQTASPWPDSRILELCKAISIIQDRDESDNSDDKMDLKNVLKRNIK